MGLCGNCTTWQDGTDQIYQADPDIAGIGIISTYIASAFITTCLSAAHLIFTISDSPATNSFDRLGYIAAKSMGFPRISDTRRKFWTPVVRKVVLSLSDQQLLTGLAVLIAGFWTHCTISVYHFALVSDLAWFSASVHCTTLTAIRSYLERPVLRDWRVALMLAMALLLVASTVMQGHYEWFDSWPYDAQCLFDNLNGNIGGEPRYWMCVTLALICLNYSLSIIPLFEKPTEFLELWFQTKPKATQDHAVGSLKKKKSHISSPTSVKGRMKRCGCTLSIIVLSTISWIYLALISLFGSQITSLAVDIFWFGYGLWGLIEDRDIPSSDMSGNENAMSFGQIMPILLLSSTLLVFMEAYDDQKKETEEEMYPHSHSSELSLLPPRSSTNAASTTSPSHSSQHSLVRTRSPTSAASKAYPSHEMTGAIQDAEDDVEPDVFPPRRVDTEMGGRSEASGVEGGPWTRELQRRQTSSLPADNAQPASGPSGQTQQASFNAS